MSRPIHALFTLVVMASLSINETFASERWAPYPDDSSWRTLKVPGMKANTFRTDDGIVEVHSDDSVSFRYTELPAGIGPPTQVHWQWRVTSYASLARQSEKGRDDRPLAVHLWFDDTKDGALFGTLGAVFGYPKIGHLLTYVWGAQEAAGSVVQNPHYARGRVIVLVGKDEPTDKWQTVRRDIARDFKTAFGTAPDLSALRYIAVSADTDDLGGKSVAAVRSLSILTR